MVRIAAGLMAVDAIARCPPVASPALDSTANSTLHASRYENVSSINIVPTTGLEVVLCCLRLCHLNTPFNVYTLNITHLRYRVKGCIRENLGETTNSGLALGHFGFTR